MKSLPPPPPPPPPRPEGEEVSMETSARAAAVPLLREPPPPPPPPEELLYRLVAVRLPDLTPVATSALEVSDPDPVAGETAAEDDELLLLERL
jgi:hypothetical protein